MQVLCIEPFPFEPSLFFFLFRVASGGARGEGAGGDAAAAAEETCELYLQHLCRFEPKAARPFLQSCETYRVQRCLALCKEHHVDDAEAYLLERIGDVAAALQLCLAALDDTLAALTLALRTQAAAVSVLTLAAFSCLQQSPTYSTCRFASTAAAAISATICSAKLS